jgi:pimeloyl-ACP methyl ester carboxylesterase
MSPRRDRLSTLVREYQLFVLVIWGQHDLSSDLSEPDAYRRDVPRSRLHVLDAGHFALDTKAEEIAGLVRTFVSTL